jgi:hypothetical protein
VPVGHLNQLPLLPHPNVRTRKLVVNHHCVVI